MSSQPPEISDHNEAMLSAAVRLYDRVNEILAEGMGIWVTDIDPELHAVQSAAATLSRVIIAHHRPILYNETTQQIEE
jgi:hypothetical protein